MKKIKVWHLGAICNATLIEDPAELAAEGELTADGFKFNELRESPEYCEKVECVTHWNTEAAYGEPTPYELYIVTTPTRFLWFVAKVDPVRVLRYAGNSLRLDYLGGESRENPGKACDYMKLVYLDKHGKQIAPEDYDLPEIYAEVVLGDEDEEDTEDELAEAIRDQMLDACFDSDLIYNVIEHRGNRVRI